MDLKRLRPRDSFTTYFTVIPTSSFTSLTNMMNLHTFFDDEAPSILLCGSKLHPARSTHGEDLLKQLTAKDHRPMADDYRSSNNQSNQSRRLERILNKDDIKEFEFIINVVVGIIVHQGAPFAQRVDCFQESFITTLSSW
jgi:hypothetical protein